MTLSEETRKLFQILRPDAAARALNFLDKEKRFVHYTSAENALSILKTKKVWMRNALCMNDFSEVEHGSELVLDFFREKKNLSALKDALHLCHPNSFENVKELFEGWLPTVRDGTYVTSISEHDDHEDGIGRLSMWRAYRGNRAGIALVFKPAPFFLETEALAAYASPASYFGKNEFEIDALTFIANLNENFEHLSNIPRDIFVHLVLRSLIFWCVCSKHAGFAEEREWRIVHLPNMYPSSDVKSNVEVVDGVPQLVYKIGLKNIPDEGLTGIEPHEILDQVIIGPTDYPLAIYDAFRDVLQDIGIEKPEEIVRVSNIPIRN